MTKVATADIESTIRNDEVGAFKANPHSPKNFAVLSGYKFLGEENGKAVYTTKASEPCESPMEDITVLVGHNIGFDLLYFYRNPKWRKWLHTGAIWDTMVAEYLLTGQESKFASLNQLSEKYGGTQKDDKIAEYWKQGIDTVNIPNDELVSYWKEDLRNTEKVFIAQIKRAKKKGMLKFIRSQMNYRLATVEAEWNGMYFNREVWKLEFRALKSKMELSYQNILQGMVKTFHHDTPGDWYNVNSNDQISLLLFGGEQKFTVNKPMVDAAGLPMYYKSGAKKGRTRFKKETIVHKIENRIPTGFTEPMAKSGFWKTNEEILESILNDKSQHRWSPTIKNILEYRALLKEETSFMLPYKNMTWDHDFCIHQKYNHTVTPTGRISCSEPNLQQVVNSGD